MMKTINGLMKHMRQKGVAINGSKQKNQLRNLGYYHGYKGYRYASPSQALPFTKFEDLVRTATYDSQLKELLFPKLMFIETSIRNIALETIMSKIGGDSLNSFFDKAIKSYRDFGAPLNRKQKDQARQIQQRKNKLRSKLIGKIAEAYEKKNRKVAHYYESSKYSYIPLWAVFEICMMGELDFIMQSLKPEYRKAISKELNMLFAYDTNVMVVADAINVLRYLRNACAHNDVVYDSRFAAKDPSSELKNFLRNEMGIESPTFKKITDYIAIICIFLRKLGMNKTETRSFLGRFERITKSFEKEIPENISSLVLPKDWEIEIHSISIRI